ncbi:MAG: preprotein translocase subunit SecE [Bacteroidales bacterium]|jgi:preprotein translocase subunit SecE|nr:preprotein translocase subunit SecE [Bacteroidales bacterium]
MKLVNYIKGTYDELAHKVTWPTASALQDSVVKVCVASLIIILIVLVMDLLFNTIMKVMFF